MSDKIRNVGRRNALKIVGAGLGFGSLSAVGSATNNQKDLGEVYEQARKIREQTNSQERFLEYLRSHCTNLTTYTNNFKKPNHAAKSSEEVSTEKVESSDMTGTLTIGGDYTHTLADYKVEIDGGYGTGEKNNDAVTISWKSEDYDLPQDGTHTDNADNVHLVSSSFDGAMWSYSDYDGCAWGCDLWFSVGVNVERQTEETPRKIQATYQSVWDESTTVSGMTVDTDGNVKITLEEGSLQYVEQIDRQVREESFETHL